MLILIFACVLAATVAIAGFGGAIKGRDELNIRATQTTIAEVQAQYERGLADLQEGNYELAAQRFRWILEHAPDHAGAAQGLAQAESLLNLAASPAATLPPSGSTNPEELFAEAQGFYAGQQWASAIIRLQELQAIDPNYRADEVREMLYESLVTLGLIYVRGDRLQEGLALLDQAEDIRPLDDQAAGERRLASLYITGRTYETLNWAIAIDNYQAIYDVAPNYRDVEDRLWTARVRFGDQLVAAGGHCDAALQYDAALQIREDEEVRARLDAALLACSHPTPTPFGMPPAGGTPTPFGTLPPGVVLTQPPSPGS